MQLEVPGLQSECEGGPGAPGQVRGVQGPPRGGRLGQREGACELLLKSDGTKEGAKMELGGKRPLYSSAVKVKGCSSQIFVKPCI